MSKTGWCSGGCKGSRGVGQPTAQIFFPIFESLRVQPVAEAEVRPPPTLSSIHARQNNLDCFEHRSSSPESFLSWTHLSRNLILVQRLDVFDQHGHHELVLHILKQSACQMLNCPGLVSVAPFGQR